MLRRCLRTSVCQLSIFPAPSAFGASPGNSRRSGIRMLRRCRRTSVCQLAYSRLQAPSARRRETAVEAEFGCSGGVFGLRCASSPYSRLQAPSARRRATAVEAEFGCSGGVVGLRCASSPIPGSKRLRRVAGGRPKERSRVRMLGGGPGVWGRRAGLLTRFGRASARAQWMARSCTSSSPSVSKPWVRTKKKAAKRSVSVSVISSKACSPSLCSPTFST